MGSGEVQSWFHNWAERNTKTTWTNHSANIAHMIICQEVGSARTSGKFNYAQSCICRSNTGKQIKEVTPRLTHKGSLASDFLNEVLRLLLLFLPSNQGVSTSKSNIRKKRARVHSVTLPITGDSLPCILNQPWLARMRSSQRCKSERSPCVLRETSGSSTLHRWDRSGRHPEMKKHFPIPFILLLCFQVKRPIKRWYRYQLRANKKIKSNCHPKPNLFIN